MDRSLHVPANAASAEFLWRGQLPAAQVRVTAVTPDAPDPRYDAAVSADWQRRLAAKPDDLMLFDGPLFHVSGSQLVVAPDGAETLVIEGSPTSYRYWLYSAARHDWIAREFGADHGCRPLAVAAAVFTSDQRLVLLRRSARVAELPGWIHVAAGHLDPQAHRRSGRPDPTVAILAELREELGLQTSELHAGMLLALVQSKDNGKPELLYRFDATVSCRELSERSAGCESRDETDQLLFAPIEPAAFLNWCEPHRQRLTVPTCALLQCLGLLPQQVRIGHLVDRETP